jgi:hypothetical protein
MDTDHSARQATGIEVLDQALQSFEQEFEDGFEEPWDEGGDHFEPMCPDGYVSLEMLRNPICAQGMCTTVSAELYAYLTDEDGDYEHGYEEHFDMVLCASDLTDRGYAKAYPQLGEIFYGKPHTPDVFGYADRTTESPFPWHDAVLVTIQGQTLMIDYTAAQYGYESVPLIQRLTPDGWQRL